MLAAGAAAQAAAAAIVRAAGVRRVQMQQQQLPRLHSNVQRGAAARAAGIGAAYRSAGHCLFSMCVCSGPAGWVDGGGECFGRLAGQGFVGCVLASLSMKTEGRIQSNVWQAGGAILCF